MIRLNIALSWDTINVKILIIILFSKEQIEIQENIHLILILKDLNNVCLLKISKWNHLRNTFIFDLDEDM